MKVFCHQQYGSCKMRLRAGRIVDERNVTRSRAMRLRPERHADVTMDRASISASVSGARGYRSNAAGAATLADYCAGRPGTGVEAVTTCQCLNRSSWRTSTASDVFSRPITQTARTARSWSTYVESRTSLSVVLDVDARDHRGLRSAAEHYVYPVEDPAAKGAG